MSSETGVENTPAVVETAPETPATAAETTPEVKPETTTKTFTQEELDQIVSKRLAREQRKWEREQRLAQPATVEQPQGSSDEAPELTIEQRVEQEIQRRAAQKAEAEAREAFFERAEQAIEKYPDFEAVAYNSKLPVTDEMAQTIRASEIGPEILYHLGTNPKEAERISRLSPFLQAKEIGRIEAKLAEAPPPKKTTKAPEPIEPVTPRGNGGKTVDTTDPKAAKEMDTSEWIAAERERQRRKQAARH